MQCDTEPPTPTLHPPPWRRQKQAQQKGTKDFEGTASCLPFKYRAKSPFHDRMSPICGSSTDKPREQPVHSTAGIQCSPSEGPGRDPAFHSLHRPGAGHQRPSVFQHLRPQVLALRRAGVRSGQVLGSLSSATISEDRWFTASD